jgi:glycine oxidase
MIGEPPPRASDPASLLEAASGPLHDRLAAELLEETGLDVGLLREGWLSVAWTESQEAELEAADAQARRLGQESRVLRGKDLRDLEPALSDKARAARCFPGGHVENRMLVEALKASGRRSGLGLVLDEAVVSVSTDGAGTLTVRSRREVYQAGAAVLAAGAWSGQIQGLPFKIPVKPQRGQILALRPEGRPLTRVILEAEDFPYLVPRKDGRIIVGATREDAGFDRSLTQEGVSGLLRTAVQVAPGLARAPLAETWTGFRPVSPDGLPLIGPSSLEGLYLLTGHGPAGIGPAPASALLLAQIISGEAPALDPAPFDPRRFRSAPVL